MSSKTQALNKLHIPDTLAKWPWPRQQNPAYEEQKALSSAWFRSFNAFDTSYQKAFDLCDFSLPFRYTSSNERLTLLFRPLSLYWIPSCGSRPPSFGMRSNELFLMFDDYSDVAEPDVVRKQADVIMDAIRHPHIPRPKDEFIGGEVFRQFWELARKGATPTAQRRFIEVVQLYVNAVVQQAIDRADNHIRDFNSYFQVRRNTIAAKPIYSLLEFTMDIPDEVMQHPVIHELSILSIDMIIITNDLYSYNVEQAHGDNLHNLITIVMNQYNLDVQGAMDWIGRHNDKLVDRFLEIYRDLPDWGPVINPQIRRYCDGVGNWVRANDAWSLSCWRYFREEAPEFEKTRCVELMPRKEEAKIFPNLTVCNVKLQEGFLSDITPQPNRKLAVQ